MMIPGQIDQMTFEELKTFAYQLSQHSGNIMTNLYSTSVPIDEQVMAERVGAIQTLTEQLIFTLDGLEHNPSAYTDPPPRQI